MSNKPMLSVERELLERASRQLLDWECADDGEEVKRTFIELRTLLDKPQTCSESQVEPGSHAPFEAAVKMRSDIDSYLERHGYLRAISGISLHNACIALYHKGYRLPDEQPAPVAVVMPDVDELAQIIRKVDGSHTLGAGSLAEAILEKVAKLNGVKP